MRQALHIFGKDVRHLRWEITLVLALTATFAFSDNQKLANDRDQFLKVLLSLSWLYLIGRVIHAEALPGNKQFWLTRPYSRKSLFAAKVLFLWTFITLPMMVSDSMIIWMTGFSPAEHLSGLLWEQVLRWMVLIAPGMAVAAITTGIAEQAGSLLLGLVFFFCVTQLSERGFSDWGVREWIRTSIGVGVAGAGAAAIVILQYLWRRTMPARVAAAGLVGLGSLIAFLPPVGERRKDAASISVTLDRSIPIGTAKRGRFVAPHVELPLRLAGMPDGLTPWADDVTVGIDGIFGGLPVEWEVVDGSGIRQLMGISPAFLDRIKNTLVRIHTSVTLTLVRNPQTTALSRTTMVPGVGLCNPFLSCWCPFRTARVVVADNWIGREPAFTSYSPFPAEFGISPIVMLDPSRFQTSKPTPVTVTTAEPVAHLHFDFDIDNVRLADFEVH
jgi:hypothetical protein